MDRATIIFGRELDLIVNEELKMATISYFNERVPLHFWTDSASSSGKFHPQLSQGEGGLVRHTKAVVMFAEELLRMSTYAYMKDEYKDYVIVACLVHDTMKYGLHEYDKKEYRNHAKNASIAFAEWCRTACGFEPSEFLLGAIASHMGQWSTNKEDRPFTNIDRCVHMADYMASRPFIDIPSLREPTEQSKAQELENLIEE